MINNSIDFVIKNIEKKLSINQDSQFKDFRIEHYSKINYNKNGESVLYGIFGPEENEIKPSKYVIKIMLTEPGLELDVMRYINLNDKNKRQFVCHMLNDDDDDGNYIIMKRLCMTIEDYISKKNKFELYKINLFAKQLMKTLDWLHSIGIVHCDIKTENIMIETKYLQKVRLIDFGISKLKDEISLDIPTTITTRAPEAWTKKWDEKIDVFSLGCVLYKMYTGNFLIFYGYNICDGHCGYIRCLEQNLGTKLPDHILPEIECDNEHCLDRTFETKNIKIFDNENCKNDTIQEKLFKDLLKKMLEYDPQKRWSMKQCLEHDFFK